MWHSWKTDSPSSFYSQQHISIVDVANRECSNGILKNFRINFATNPFDWKNWNLSLKELKFVIFVENTVMITIFFLATRDSLRGFISTVFLFFFHFCVRFQRSHIHFKAFICPCQHIFQLTWLYVQFKCTQIASITFGYQQLLDSSNSCQKRLWITIFAFWFNRSILQLL